MKQGIFTIKENTQLTPTTWRMVLAGDTSAITAPGQFINIRLDGHFLRRPVSVNDVKHAEPYTGEGLGTGSEEGAVTIIYKVLGQGTEEMTAMPAGTQLDVLTGLGNGFALSRAGEEIGCDIVSPFMTMALIPLACLPELRLTDRGLVDCTKFCFSPLEVEE